MNESEQCTKRHNEIRKAQTFGCASGWINMFTIFFDLETGGLLDTQPDIQLAAIAVDDSGTEVSQFEAKLQFNEVDADPEALKMNGYDREVWKAEAIPPADAVRKFSKWMEPYRSIEMISKRTGNPYSMARLAGYNALTFDFPRLRRLYGDQFFPCSYHVLDCLQLAAWKYFDRADKPNNLKLTTVCEFLGIPVDGAHDALADARLAAKLAWRLRQ